MIAITFSPGIDKVLIVVGIAMVMVKAIAQATITWDGLRIKFLA